MTAVTSAESTPEGQLEDADEALPPRPIKDFETRPKTAARNRLLKEFRDLGFDEASSVAMVRAIDDPDQALAQLKAPAEFGVHGGTIRYIAVRIRNGAALPIPTNPRVSARVRYPAGDSGSGGIEPLTIADGPNDAATLTISAASAASLKSDMREGHEYITGNNDLLASVQTQGVLLPITLVPVKFQFHDSTASRTVVCTIDGSSRLTAAMRTWGLSAEDVLFTLTEGDALDVRRREVAQLMSQDKASLTQADFARLRNQALPANLIIGWESDEPGITFRHVLDAYLGLLHVEPPTPWGDAAGQDKRADSVLDELERRGRIDTTRRQYLAGLLTPEEATTAGYNATLDGRAAEIFYELDRRQNANAVNRALRRIGMHNPDRLTRLEVATELAMRPYRRSATELARRNPRQALPNALTRLRPDNLWAPTGRSPEELLAAALDEVAAGSTGEASAELAVRGAFWLTRYSALQKSSRTDTRFAEELLQDIIRTAHGARVLHQAIVDGRAAQHPRQVNEQGEISQTPADKDMLVDDQWLRKTFVSAEPDGDGGGGEDGPEPDWTPRDELRHRIFGIRDDSGTLLAKIEALDEITEEDQKIANVDGVPKDIADEVSLNLDRARMRIVGLGTTWAARNDSTTD
ncbi:hypothetical protein [Phycicoccus sp. Soil802]|uniref:hypothetical protein n=1 Tax=Phycicoccus sp. Soil802 TaxID=1736414 RepID=UPI000713ADB9|nr:hypothetical protein [Phycicoccus sp. Soil802]KRF28937.1 hypothetical protein ASG91_04720 [Phycicoccus sp. Soil802]